MRPGRSTPVASTTSSAAPELASVPRWLRCQSDATPSSALYWHIGETTIRFASSRSASRIGENKALVMSHASILRGNGPSGGGTIGNGAPAPQAGPLSGGGALRRRGVNLGLHGKDLVLGARGDLSPALAGLDRFAHAQEELLLGEVVLPAAGLIELDKIGPASFREGTPFQRDFLECMRGEPGGHG